MTSRKLKVVDPDAILSAERKGHDLVTCAVDQSAGVYPIKVHLETTSLSDASDLDAGCVFVFSSSPEQLTLIEQLISLTSQSEPVELGVRPFDSELPISDIQALPQARPRTQIQLFLHCYYCWLMAITLEMPLIMTLCLVQAMP